MGRPKTPLIDPGQIVTKALEHIDARGLEKFSVRRVASDLGVNSASLYHYFKNKDGILAAVRLRVLTDANLRSTPAASLSWQEFLRRSVKAYRRALLAHPNVTPLLHPSSTLPFSAQREKAVSKLTGEGVPDRYAYVIIDSAETLAYGSALIDPRGVGLAARFNPISDDDAPNLRRALRLSPRSPEDLFSLQLDALITGWSEFLQGISPQRAEHSTA